MAATPTVIVGGPTQLIKNRCWNRDRCVTDLHFVCFVWCGCGSFSAKAGGLSSLCALKHTPVGPPAHEPQNIRRRRSAERLSKAVAAPRSRRTPGWRAVSLIKRRSEEQCCHSEGPRQWRASTSSFPSSFVRPP
ncbi:uncharacterized protein NP_7052A (plasmid) [Natronomonas pharaonis DSM 2160]|uniref:Uncharacterized protein n=1 Tax=Natronomonas pharaonis (strain ATCC 35678 / DSM 2160 / CIP 103997 / JCM 8858 / NBRC 14720 / NCIMB 2260 / Gabara) TaxID=348780 RepID=Q3ILS8_NATPD|nr:uncharacterized protein NP_3328A [Natronomonas pharaonis DSM 2160]CAI50942.1 uncharacterized protein NP_7052A [Natronomonas pharaonis DSM 2160]